MTADTPIWKLYPAHYRIREVRGERLILASWRDPSADPDYFEPSCSEAERILEGGNL